MKSDELFEIIKTRRNVNPLQYGDAEISELELSQILESANWAPTHKRTEPWRFKVIQGQGKVKFAEFMVQKYMENTPAESQTERKKLDIIDKCNLSNKIILINMKASGMLPEWEELASTAMAVQNMWLMSTAMGIGAYWSSPSTISKMNEFVAFEDGEKCFGIFYMGKLKSDLVEGTRKPMADKIQVINH